MPSDISGYLDTIINSQYGEQVRDSIYNSILALYRDVNSGETLAAAAAASANEAASRASSVAALYTDVDNIVKDWTMSSGGYKGYDSKIQTALSEWTTAKGEIASCISDIDEAIASAATVAVEWDNPSFPSRGYKYKIESILTAWDDAWNYTGASTAATGYKYTIINAVASATNLIDSMSSAVNAWGPDEGPGYKKQIIDSLSVLSSTVSQASTTLGEMNEAKRQADAFINGLTVAAIDLDENTPPYVEIDTFGNSKKITFGLRRGQTGASNIIKGEVYATYEALEAARQAGDISPAEGDQYHVGTEPPYDIYRWTGAQWSNEGQGLSLVNLVNSDITTMWDNDTAISSTTKKYIPHDVLYFLLHDKIKGALNNKVTVEPGKGLSTVDFSDSYSTKFGNPAASLATSAQNLIGAVNELVGSLDNKVSKSGNKVLSDNNYTDTDKQAVGTVISLNETVTSLEEEVNNKCFHVNVSAKSAFPVTITDSRITSGSRVIGISLGTPTALASDLTWTTATNTCTLAGTMISGVSTTFSIDFANF